MGKTAGSRGIVIAIIFLPIFLTLGTPEDRTERFDRDPGWDGHNNRTFFAARRTIRQDFGYSATHHAGGEAGEVGGLMTPAAEPAYYARKIPTKTFDDILTASGRLACVGQEFHVLIGFFNASTLGAWRTPNTIALRLYGRGNVFYAYVEYASKRWRASGDNPVRFTVRDPESGKEKLREFAGRGAGHTWSLTYNPHGNNGQGAVTATLDDQKAICHLEPGHKGDGAIFNRFGFLNVMKHADGGGEIWLDDVIVIGETEHFNRDPGWDRLHNRHTYTTSDVRPRFDFGFSPTHFAGGKAPGEMGGLVFRGDGRYPEITAWYGDRLTLLTLSKPLEARGKICLRRGVSDSTTLIGFFHSSDSTRVESSQASALPENFLGVAIEGPSREGFFLYPVYRLKGGGQDASYGPAPLRIYPDGSAHDWSLVYTPQAEGNQGKIAVTLDDKSAALEMEANHTDARARFDRFGIVTTRIDGAGQYIYFDDLTYTCNQER